MVSEVAGSECQTGLTGLFLLQKGGGQGGGGEGEGVRADQLKFSSFFLPQQRGCRAEQKKSPANLLASVEWWRRAAGIMKGLTSLFQRVPPGHSLAPGTI